MFAFSVFIDLIFGFRISVLRFYGNNVNFEIDGVGPFDNRPSADKLHHSVKKMTHEI